MARTASKSSKASKNAKPKVAKVPKEKVIKARDPLKYNVGPAQNHFYHGQVFVVMSDETRARYAATTGAQATTNRNNPNYRQGAEFANRLASNKLYEGEVLVLDVDNSKMVTDPDSGLQRPKVILNITGDEKDVAESITNFVVYMKKHTSAGQNKSDETLYQESMATTLEMLRDPGVTVRKEFYDNPQYRAQQLEILNAYRKNAEQYKERNIFPYDIEMLNSIRVSNKSASEFTKKEKKPKSKQFVEGEGVKKRGSASLFSKIVKQGADKTKLISLVKFGTSIGTEGRKKSLVSVQQDKVGGNTVLTVGEIQWLIGSDRDVELFTEQLLAENPEGSVNYAPAIALARELNAEWSKHKQAHTVTTVAVPPASVIIQNAAPLTIQQPVQQAPVSASVSSLVLPQFEVAPKQQPTLFSVATPVSVSSSSSNIFSDLFNPGGGIAAKPVTQSVLQQNIPGLSQPAATPLFQAPKQPAPIAATPLLQTPIQQSQRVTPSVLPVTQPQLNPIQGLANAAPSTGGRPVSISSFWDEVPTPSM